MRTEINRWAKAFHYPGGHRFMTRSGGATIAIKGEEGMSFLSRHAPIRPYGTDDVGRPTYRLRLYRGFTIITQMEMQQLVNRYGFKVAEAAAPVGAFKHGDEVIVGRHERRGRVLGPVHTFGLEPEIPVLFENPKGPAYTQSIGVKHVRPAPTMSRNAAIVYTTRLHKRLLREAEQLPTNSNLARTSRRQAEALKVLLDEIAPA